jgi:hypothetical protein
MKNSFTMCSLLLALVPTITGCKSVLLPTDDAYQPQNNWQTYEQALAAFDKITTHQTSIHDLCAMGFDPTNSPNMRVLTYLDVIQRFLPNQSITKGDLPNDVRYCLEAKDGCRGFELVIDSTKRKRYGNLPLDMMGFKKNTRITGWTFHALLVVQNDVVTYKLSSGEPNIDRVEKKFKPLGPFQEVEGLVAKLPGML